MTGYRALGGYRIDQIRNAMTLACRDYFWALPVRVQLASMTRHRTPPARRLLLITRIHARTHH